MNLTNNTLNIIIKAHKFTYGDKLIDDIRQNKVSLVIVALDAGADSKKRVHDKCNYYQIECLDLFTKEELFNFFKKNISSFGITDINLTKKFKENLKKEV